MDQTTSEIDAAPSEKKFIDNAKTEKKSSKYNSGLGLISIEYWQTYFDVNQEEIKQRILASLNPISPQFSSLISEKPDLYGPFWICSFLIFMLVIGGNFLNVMHKFIVGSAIVYFFVSYKNLARDIQF